MQRAEPLQDAWCILIRSFVYTWDHSTQPTGQHAAGVGHCSLKLKRWDICLWLTSSMDTHSDYKHAGLGKRLGGNVWRGCSQRDG